MATRSQAPTVLAGALVRKLSGVVALPADAEAAFACLESDRRTVGRGAQLAVQGQPHGNVQIVLAGSGIRYKLLPDGRRQIINFALPGDFIDLRACLFDRAQLSALALEPMTVAVIEPRALLEVVRTFPTAGAAMFWMAAMEQSLLSERIVAIGRQTAYERLAHLFLTLHERLRLIGLADADGFSLPLSQELLADTLGLSVVHVSRTLARMRADGRLTLKSGRVTIHDSRTLAAVSDFEPGYLRGFPPSSTALAAIGGRA